MNSENQGILHREFEFLRPRGGLGQSLMYFGAECDDGWFELIYNLCHKIKIELEKEAHFIGV